MSSRNAARREPDSRGQAGEWKSTAKRASQKSREKVFQKTLKKGLTNFRKCGIINELPLLKRELKNKKNCILKTEQCEKEKARKTGTLGQFRYKQLDLD